MGLTCAASASDNTQKTSASSRQVFTVCAVCVVIVVSNDFYVLNLDLCFFFYSEDERNDCLK